MSRLPPDHSDLADVNPFSTRYIRPGALPFLFSAGAQAADLVARLRQQRWWGQIVGPHGSGKSSLLAALRPSLETAGLAPLIVTLHQGQRRLDVALNDQLAGQTRLMVIDGYEQLGWMARCRLKHFCRRHGLGLLVTSHRGCGLPPLFQTQATLPQAQAIVEQLQAGFAARIAPDDVRAALQRHGGNLREMLFDLYDLYESRRRGTE